MILAGAERGCLREVLVIAAALGIQDPRERPRAAQQKADDVHRRFRDDASDFVGLLRLWAFVRDAESRGTLAPAARLQGELPLVPARARVGRNPPAARRRRPRARSRGAGGRRLAALSGRTKRGPAGDRATRSTSRSSPACSRRSATAAPSSASTWARGRRASPFTRRRPSRASRPRGSWRSSSWRRRSSSRARPRRSSRSGCSRPAPHLLKRSYADPHWSEKSARASVKEHVTLFGLPVFRDRSVDYATVAPAEARRMFLDHALVRGEYTDARRVPGEEPRAPRRGGAPARQGAAERHARRRRSAPRLLRPARPGERRQRQDVRGLAREAEKDDPGVALLSLRGRARRRSGPAACRLPGRVDAPRRDAFPWPTASTLARTTTGSRSPSRSSSCRSSIPGSSIGRSPAGTRTRSPRSSTGSRARLRRELGSIPELAQRPRRAADPFRGPMIPALAAAVAEACGVNVPE